MTNIISTPTSIIYLGTRKNTERARGLLKKAVRLGIAPKPDNACNLFAGRTMSSAKIARKPIFSIPCGLFMTDDIGVPARLSATIPVLVVARNENTRTTIYFKGHRIF